MEASPPSPPSQPASEDVEIIDLTLDEVDGEEEEELAPTIVYTIVRPAKRVSVIRYGGVIEID